MSQEAVGIVGGGRVARIILAGWQRANRLPSHVVVSDSDSGVARAAAGASSLR